MTTAKMSSIVLLLASPIGPARRRRRQPEVFTGTAQAKNANGAVSGTLEVRLRRVTPEFDKKGRRDGAERRRLSAVSHRDSQRS